MLDVIRSILKKMKVTAVIAADTCSYRELSCARIQYIKDNKYFLAESYYTDVWLASTPLGPSLDNEGYIIADNIYDVAGVREFNSYSQLKQAPIIKQDSLKEIFEYFDSSSERYLAKLFSNLQAFHDIHFSFKPRPCILSTVIDSGEFLGVISISLDSSIEILSKTSDRLDQIISKVNSTTLFLEETFYG